MTQLKQWYFSVEEEDTFPSETMVGKTFEEYPTTEKEFEEIDEVIFSIDIDEMEEIEELPNFLTKLPNLKSIGIPIDWLDEIEIPKNLLELRLFGQVYSYGKKEKWPIDLKFHSLKHLSVPELVKPYEISITDFSTLESIEYDFAAEKNNAKIIEIAKLPRLKRVVVNQAKNMDVFSPFENTGMTSLELFACTGKKLPVENIVKLKKLKDLKINNISVELDCNLLLQLEELEKLTLLNIRNITNIEALLRHKKLKYLYVIVNT